MWNTGLKTNDLKVPRVESNWKNSRAFSAPFWYIAGVTRLSLVLRLHFPFKFLRYPRVLWYSFVSIILWYFIYFQHLSSMFSPMDHSLMAEHWQHAREARARNEEYLQGYPHGTLSDSDMTLTDPDMVSSDSDMSLSDPDDTMSDWIVNLPVTASSFNASPFNAYPLNASPLNASPVNTPSADSDSGLDISDDISMDDVEDVSGANQEHLSDDSKSDIVMGESSDDDTQHHHLGKEELRRLWSLFRLSFRIFNSLSIQKDSAATKKTVTETTPSEKTIESQDDYEMVDANVSGGSAETTTESQEDYEMVDANVSGGSPEINIESQEDYEMGNVNVSGGLPTNNNIKMMFVSGETAEPSPETTTLIEEITRQQVIEIVRTSHSAWKLLSLMIK
jgi:hypothetical protein